MDTENANKIYCFEIEKEIWEKIKISGKKIHPRIYSSFSVDYDKNSLYLIGGFDENHNFFSLDVCNFFFLFYFYFYLFILLNSEVEKTFKKFQKS